MNTQFAQQPGSTVKFDIEPLEERIAPSVVGIPQTTGSSDVPGPGAVGTAGSAEFHTTDSNIPGFIAF